MHVFVRADDGSHSAAPRASSEVAPFGFIEQDSFACPPVALRSIGPRLECSADCNAAQ